MSGAIFQGSASFKSPITQSVELGINMAMLRATSVVNDELLNLSGYITPYDGATGVFQGKSGAVAGTYVDNGGTIIVPTGGDGSSAWIRQYSGRANIKWFGCVGSGLVEEGPSLQLAVDSNLPLWFPPGFYLVDASPVFVNSAYVDWLGVKEQSWLIGNSLIIPGSTPADDLTYPSDTYVGPMSGSCFYWVSTVYYPKIKGLSFRNFKFGVSYLNTPNTPVFEDCYYINCNAFTFFYKNCQIPTFISVTAAGPYAGPLLIASSTAAPVGSPWAGQGAYTWFIQSIIYEGNGAAFGGGKKNAAFDTWFQNSILRPTVANAPGNANTGTTLAEVYPYAITDLECQPSGFMFYVAGRVCPGADLIAHNLYLSFGGESGCAMINTNVNISIDYYSIEYEGASFPSHFILGSSNGVVISNTTTEGFPNTPLINYTGKDINTSSNGTMSVADNSNSVYINTYPGKGNIQNTVNGVPLLATTGINNGQLLGQNVSLSSLDIGPTIINITGFGGSNYSILTSEQYMYGSIKMQDGLSRILHGVREFALPIYDNTNSAYCSQLVINAPNQPHNLSGTLEILVLDVASGETDYGKFFINSISGNYTYVLTAAANNGDTSISIALNGTGSIPDTYLNGYLFLAIGTVGVVATSSFGGSSATLNLLTPIGGLPSGGAPIGTVVTPRPMLTEIIPFKRDIIKLTTSNGLTISSNRFTNGATAFGPSDSSVNIKTVFTSVGELPVKCYTDGVPTTSDWATGSGRLYERNPVPGSHIGYVYVPDGLTPAWQPYGAIEPAVTVLNGISSGSIEYTQYDGTSKKFIAQFLDYSNTTTGTQSITFRVPFKNVPIITENSFGIIVSVTTTTITFDGNITGPVNGIVIAEGM